MIGFWETQEEMEKTPVLEMVVTKRRTSTRMSGFLSIFGQKPEDIFNDDHPEVNIFNLSKLPGSTGSKQIRESIPNITITGGSDGQTRLRRKRKLSDQETRDSKRWRGWCLNN